MDFLVVDSIDQTRNKYRLYIEQSVANSQIFDCSNAEDAFFTLFDKGGDVIVCSETLSFRSGYELASLVKKVKPNIPVIIIATDDKHALQAIKCKVFDILVEPFSLQQFSECIKNAVDSFNQNQTAPPIVNNESVKIQLGLANGYRLVNIDSLAYCMADGAYTNLYFNNGESELSGYYLGRIEKLLADFPFVRINRSVLINLRFLKQIDKRTETCELVVNDELKLFKISRVNINNLHNINIL
ncbi:MAG TPA: LytTR family transcriptional regulator DNA-binding domain-containing protein [Prolixibacteraceae bacterium]|nr:LytTR family transcriptional regulator DNA-binding domain-containing protein [Prolixibacteraceae bacterium]HPR61402.1 LytTR family transcriptional regulator DNA-binding domain-containing protein [Prolixibacteraceae bacterium]